MERDIIQRIQAFIRDVPDFPLPGVTFKDITPLLGNAELLRQSIRALAEAYREESIQKVAGIDARGFIFATGVAMELGAGLVPVRKKGKLPWKTRGLAYDLEYGSAEIEMHEDSMQPGERILLVDDLLATGGTAGAAQQLIMDTGAELIGTAFLIELEFLKGRERLPAACVTRSLITY